MGLIKDFWKGIKDIFTGETFMKNFNKDDLKNGMVVKTRHKGEFLVIGDVLLDEDDKFNLNNYKDNLIHNADHDLDIMAVYSVKTCAVDNIYDLIYCDSCQKLIWKREEEKPKYKVGDRVKVKDDLSGKFRISIFPEMRSLAGKVLTVTVVRPNRREGIAYSFKETGYELTEDVIDCLVDYEEMTVSEIEKKLGYKVKIVDGE